MARDVMAELRDEIARHQVLIYMKGSRLLPQCGFSATTVRVLEQLGVPFETVDILADPEKRQGIKELSNWPTIPQVYIGGKFVGGCDIVCEMFEQGELQTLVGGGRGDTDRSA